MSNKSSQTVMIRLNKYGPQYQYRVSSTDGAFGGRRGSKKLARRMRKMRGVS